VRPRPLPLTGPGAALPQWKIEHFVALGIGVILAIAGVRQALQKRAIPLGKCVGAEGNKFVFLEVAIDGRPAGRIEIELFSWVAPRAVENFRCLCTGEKGGSKNWPGRKLHFKGTRFHRIIPGFMMQGGDITGKDGLGAESVYGGPFEDEWQHGMVKHTERGLLSMANAGPDTNGSQFFITSWRCNWIDGKHVCFGRVLNAMQSKALDRIEDCGVMDEDQPVEKQVVIPPPPPSLPYELDASRPSSRTNRTRLVPPPVLTGHVSRGRS